jgi:hypothetical protein
MRRPAVAGGLRSPLTGISFDRSARRPPRGPAIGDQDEDWQRKGATLSDKTARQEFGLTQNEIAGAIRAGRLQYWLSSAHRNPSLRLLRREVEDLAKAGYGDRHIKERQATAELARVNAN